MSFSAVRGFVAFKCLLTVGIAAGIGLMAYAALLWFRISLSIASIVVLFYVIEDRVSLLCQVMLC